MLLECCKAQVGLPQQAEGIQHNVPAEHDINAIISQIAKIKGSRESCFVSLATVTLVRSQKSILQPLLFSCVFSIEVISETHLSQRTFRVMGLQISVSQSVNVVA